MCEAGITWRCETSLDKNGVSTLSGVADPRDG